YDSGLRVPLIIRWPKDFPAPKQIQPNTVDDRLLMSLDFAPTMLDIAGAKKSGKMQGEIILGDRAAPPRKYVFGARDRCDETVILATSPEHQAVLLELRGAVDRWIEESNDQGRQLEPPEIAAAKGATKAGSDPNSGSTQKAKQKAKKQKAATEAK